MAFDITVTDGDLTLATLAQTREAGKIGVSDAAVMESERHSESFEFKRPGEPTAKSDAITDWNFGVIALLQSSLSKRLVPLSPRLTSAQPGITWRERPPLMAHLSTAVATSRRKFTGEIRREKARDTRVRS